MGIEQWVPGAMMFPWKNEVPIGGLEKCQWKTGRSIPFQRVKELSSRKEEKIKHIQIEEKRNNPQ